MTSNAYLSFGRDPAIGVIVMTSCGDFDDSKTLAMAIQDQVAAIAH
jgi:hypothetical protein